MKFIKRHGVWIGIAVLLAGGVWIVWNPLGLHWLGFLAIPVGVFFHLISDPAPSTVKCR